MAPERLRAAQNGTEPLQRLTCTLVSLTFVFVCALPKVVEPAHLDIFRLKRFEGVESLGPFDAFGDLDRKSSQHFIVAKASRSHGCHVLYVSEQMKNQDISLDGVHGVLSETEACDVMCLI